MAIAALHSAATGLRALSTQIDVVSNNLANAETNGFKRSVVNFEDLMYQTMKQPGTTNGAGDISPAGIQVGLGTNVSNTELDMTQGSLNNTGGNLDLAISGNGFFKVKILSTQGDGYGYTRNGSVFINQQGNLVVGSADGYQLLPQIKVPAGVTQLQVTQDGIVSYQKAGSNTQQTLGQITLWQFVNPQGLSQQGASVFTPTDASGAAIETKPGDNGAGTIQQGFIEASNVDPVKELVQLIQTQRAFEMNSQSIQTADQALETVANIKRS